MLGTDHLVRLSFSLGAIAHARCDDEAASAPAGASGDAKKETGASAPAEA